MVLLGRTVNRSEYLNTARNGIRCAFYKSTYSSKHVTCRRTAVAKQKKTGCLLFTFEEDRVHFPSSETIKFMISHQLM